MKPEKVLPIVVALLASGFVLQVAVRYQQKPGPVYFASWKESPKNIAEATRLARRIVRGVVSKVDRGNDLVVRVSGEPGGEDRIPIEVVSIRIEKTEKGAPAQEVKVFRTGSTKDPGLRDRAAPPMTQAPPKPPGGIDRPAQLPKPTAAEAATILLHDDPPYSVGERKLLFLTDGPTVTVAGASVRTQRLIAPEGRYLIKPDNKLQGVTERGLALQLKDKPLVEVERLIRIPVRPTPPRGPVKGP
jgi:hypothetical protein